jgi:hypothetical protein
MHSEQRHLKHVRVPSGGRAVYVVASVGINL